MTLTKFNHQIKTKFKYKKDEEVLVLKVYYLRQLLKHFDRVIRRKDKSAKINPLVV